jgi:ubiquinol-cytochrome c reductase cytochrome b/c1 subunit
MTFVWLSRIGTAYWFLYFLVITPVLGIVEKTRPVPDTISSPVLSGMATVEKA